MTARGPRHRAGRHDARRGRGAPAPPQDREAAGRRRGRPPAGPDHRQGHPEAHPVPVRDQGRAGPPARRRGASASARTPSSAREALIAAGGRRARRRHGARPLPRRDRDGRAHQGGLLGRARSSRATSRPREAAEALIDAGADAVKVGIGPGLLRSRHARADGGCDLQEHRGRAVGDRVINMHGEPVTVVNAWCTGIREVMAVRHVASPRETVVTPDHRYCVGDLVDHRCHGRRERAT